MTFTVLTAEFMHETNTFSILPTGLKAFRDRTLLEGEAALAARANANTELAGFKDVARERGWNMHHALSALAPPSGKVTREAFDHVAGTIVTAAEALFGKLDGVLLGLHGAMVTEADEDGEGALLECLRDALGDALPIAITLDPHANVTQKMCDLADIIVSFKTYPHVDMRECGRQAAGILDRMMARTINPKTIRVQLPMLEEVNGGRTDAGPMIKRLAKARTYEQRPDVFAVSINAGFGNADIHDAGPTVLVTAEGDLDAHRRFAGEIAEDIWARRHNVLNRFLPPDEAVREAKAGISPDGPVIIADYADNPGGGAYGDGTALLRAMLDARLDNACFGPMIDPAAVEILGRHKVGDLVQLELGGKTDPRIGGAPIPLSGEIILLGEGDYVGDGPMLRGLAGSWGKTAVLRVAGIDVLVVSLPCQMLDLQQFRAFGIDPAAKSIVALKSMQHFRAAFEPIATGIVICDSGALCTPNLKRLTYSKVRRPIFPLDPP